MSTYTPDTIKLRARLAELGLSQRSAAAALGIPERTMRRYVQGDTPVPALMWHALNGIEANAPQCTCHPDSGFNSHYPGCPLYR